MKLDIEGLVLPREDINTLIAGSSDWREQWGMVSSEHSYQQRGWNGQVLFGPTDWEAWLELIKDNDLKNDEDSLCMKHRNDVEFGWHNLKKTHPIRKWVEQYFNEDELNIVNCYVLPPYGYLFPHVDFTEKQNGLTKIYVPLQWEEGNEFHFYNLGNAPIRENTVWIVNNHGYVHWVLNKSKSPRVVLDIGANLNAIEDTLISSWKKMFD